jgi:hypothetical protein
MAPLHQESKFANRIKWIGLFGWVITIVFAFAFGRSDLLGAAGAVGLAALVPYVYVEQVQINDELGSMRASFGRAYHDIHRMTSSEYEQLSEDEKHQYNETGSDIGSAELAYESDLKRIQDREVILAVLLTIQWAFGAAFFDLVSWSLETGKM